MNNINDPMTGSVQLAALGNTPSAVLYLFTPRNFTEQFRRPLEYNFSGTFADALSEACTNDHINGGSVAVTSLLKNPQYATEIFPTDKIDRGFRVTTDVLSDSWTFMLIVDNEQSPGYMVPPGGGNRTIHYGTVVGEPINPSTGTLNPSAVLCIMHKTNVVKQVSYGNSGQATTRVMSPGDIDIIDGGDLVAKSEANADLHFLRPSDAFYAQSGSVDTVIGSQSAVTNATTDVKINSKLSDPLSQLHSIVTAVHRANNTVADANIGGVMNYQQGATSANSSAGFFTEFGTMLESPVNFHGGIPDGKILIGNVLSRYPNMQYQWFNIPRTDQLDIRPQAIQSASNIFSAYLSSILPQVITNYGICTLAFIYQWRNGQGVPEIHHVETQIPMADDQISQRVWAVLRYLETNVFPIVATRGDFDLMASICSIGMTRMSLNFMCDSTIDKSFYEVPSILGGYNSSVIGRGMSLWNNATQMFNLAQLVTEDRAVDQMTSFQNPTQQQFYYPQTPQLVAPNGVPIPRGMHQQQALYAQQQMQTSMADAPRPQMIPTSTTPAAPRNADVTQEDWI